MAEVVAANNIKIGMVVSEPVVNSFGQILISSGVEISEQHIKLLKMWNISCISIRTTDSEELEELTEEMINMGLERLTKRLMWQPRNANEKDLIDLGIISAVNIIARK
ncbi:MAG: hypothetical protein EPN82_16870 [Bacteroidetes bacterium]|nr:MAG: hypothetical protein EPN82_16870 [Bacteroidota bacterium]